MANVFTGLLDLEQRLTFLKIFFFLKDLRCGFDLFFCYLCVCYEQRRVGRRKDMWVMVSLEVDYGIGQQCQADIV